MRPSTERFPLARNVAGVVPDPTFNVPPEYTNAFPPAEIVPPLSTLTVDVPPGTPALPPTWSCPVVIHVAASTVTDDTAPACTDVNALPATVSAPPHEIVS